MKAPTTRPRYLVTLVHGTCARRAPWTLEGSTLRKKLTDELRDLGAKDIMFVDPFLWSGRNTHEDRRDASVRLAEKLEAQLAPENPPIQVIIAHSHGGNIAMKALGLSPAVCRNSLLVTLATPFLRFERQKANLLTTVLTLRQLASDLNAPLSTILKLSEGGVADLKKAPWWLLLMLAAYGAGILATAALLYLSVLMPLQGSFANGLRIACTWLFNSLGAQSCERASFWYWTTPALSLVILGGLPLVAAAHKKVIENTGVELNHKADEAIHRFAYFQPKAPPVRLLVLSSVVDEALGALTGAWWIHRANVWGVRALAAAGFTIAVGVAAAAVYAIATLLTQYLGGFAADFAVAAAILMLAAFAGIVAAIIRVSAAGAAKVAEHMGLGLSDFEGGLLTSVKASRKPSSDIAFTYCCYGLFELLSNSGGWLFHSRIYKHPGAIRKIAEWIMQTTTSSVSNLAHKNAELGYPCDIATPTKLVAKYQHLQALVSDYDEAGEHRQKHER